MFKKNVKVYKLIHVNSYQIWGLSTMQGKYPRLSEYNVHHALAFALGQLSAFAHRSAFSYGSPTCVQHSDMIIYMYA